MPMIELAVRLPTVDKPGLNLQMLSGENLYTYAIKEPRRVRGHIGGLVGPIIEVVVTKEADVRQENPCIHIDSMQGVEVITAVRLGNVAIRIGQGPLATCRAGVVARRCLRIHAELRHQPGTHVVVMEIAAHPELRSLDFVCPENFAGSADRVILRMSEVVDIVHVGSNFGSKELAVEGGCFRTWVPIQPGEIGKGKWLGFLYLGRSGCLRLAIITPFRWLAHEIVRCRIRSSCS